MNNKQTKLNPSRAEAAKAWQPVHSSQATSVGGSWTLLSLTDWIFNKSLLTPAGYSGAAIIQPKIFPETAA